MSQNTLFHPRTLVSQQWKKQLMCTIIRDPLPPPSIHSLLFPLPLDEAGKNSLIWEPWCTFFWYSVLRQPNKGTWLFQETPVGQYSIIYLGDKFFKASQEISSFTVRSCKTSCHKVYENMSSESKKVTLFLRADQFNNEKWLNGYTLSQNWMN